MAATSWSRRSPTGSPSSLPSDTVFARIGGDEFAVAVVGPLAREMVAGAAASLVHSIDKPFTISRLRVPRDGVGRLRHRRGPNMQPEELLRRADIAMYQAKNSAERDAVAYHATMETGALEKKQIEKALRKGIENGELTVVYQPVVRAGDLSIVSLEALVRWTSPELGAVSPAVFIPVAEDTGLIHDIGRFVVRQACEDLASLAEPQGCDQRLAGPASRSEFRRGTSRARRRARHQARRSSSLS